MTLGHFVRLHRSIFDASKILHQKCPLVVKKLVFVLLIGQQNLIHRLCHCPEESAQLLFTVLASHAQLVQYKSRNCINNYTP